MVIFGLQPTGTDCGRKSNSKSGNDWCCLRSTLRGLYAYETNHPPDSHLPHRQGVNPIMQPYYGSELVTVLPQEFEKLSTERFLVSRVLSPHVCSQRFKIVFAASTFAGRHGPSRAGRRANVATNRL